jgi:hypothetical protein
MSFKRVLTALSTLAMLAFLIMGCSSESPLGSSRPADITASVLLVNDGEPVQFAAKVAVANHEERMLAFEGIPDTVIAARNCIIVRLKNDHETPIPFSDIKKGDSLAVEGFRQQSQYVIANRIQHQTCPDGNYDLAFRDTVVTIDYAAGSFTVASHTQTILIDSATVVWGNIIYQPFQYGPGAGINHTSPNAGKIWPYRSHDTILAFTDIEVGDVVEVKADIIDSATFLAVTIKIANCQSKERCVRFDAHLATIDAETRIITFAENPWIGKVCNGANLVGLGGEELTLADFAAGDFVAVKGIPITADSLKVNEIILLPE